MTSVKLNVDESGLRIDVLQLVLAADPRTRLIIALDGYNGSTRDLLKKPPSDDETLQHLGVSKEQADFELREWINRVFRKRQGWDLVKRDGIPITMTFKKVLKLCTEA